MFSDFPKMKFPRKVVESSVDLYHDGLTLKITRKRVSKIFKMPIKSASTIWYWAKRFAEKSKGIIGGLAPLLHADETKLKTYKKEARLLFWEARRRFPIGYMPKAIRTDGYPGYRQAMVKVFGHDVKHDRFLSFKEHSNNEIENFFRCKRRFPKFRDVDSAGKYIAH